MSSSPLIGSLRLRSTGCGNQDGCGSGILAIAAAKLGAATVFAVDTDPQALEATVENARSNGVIDKINVCEPQAITPGSADILMANILLEPFLQMHDQFSLLMKHGGKIVLSGILAEQRQTLETAYANDFKFETCEQLEEWVRLAASRN